MLIGLTGLYCSGKNYIASLLEEKGFPSLDVDKLGHEAIRRERDAIIARFGADVLGKEDGEIDRRLLGEKVFGSPRELAALETIVHPVANALTGEWIAAQGEQTCVVNAALLHKSVAFDRLDAIVIVKAGLVTRLVRARKRDRLPWIELIKRFLRQSGFSSQYLKKKADNRKVDIYIINNTAGKNVRKQLDYAIRAFCKRQACKG
ncbi:MAG: dephospho-CoA kinase [Treponema sp.]|jgi:dephospho-CoA kinase|nr:dephospho-CoA kinase [Treponema sp.]